MSDKFTLENFIYQKRGTISEKMCADIIRAGEGVFNSVKDLRPEELPHGVLMRDKVQQQYGGGFERVDDQIFMPYVLDELYAELQPILMKGLADYRSVVCSVPNVRPSFTVKLQRTPHAGGFFTWHSEQGPETSCARSLAWMINLNTIEGSGDTEFLYQGIKSPAEAGKMTIFPAGLTHPHRGNPPYGCTKYILTGWYEFSIYPEMDHKYLTGFNVEK